MLQYGFEFRLFAEGVDHIFALRSSTHEPIAELVTLFAHQFDEQDLTYRLDTVQQFSEALGNRIELYVAKYDRLMPQINQFKQIVSKMSDGEHFLLLPNISCDSEQLLNLHTLLISLNENRDLDQIRTDYNDRFGLLVQNYDILALGPSKRRNIGEPIKRKRTCRFCGKVQPDVQFRRKAHAISEALGNKNIVLYEECDHCNELLGKSIEQDLISFLDFYRSLYGVPGKPGKPKKKGKNFTLQQGEKGFEIRSSNVTTNKEGMPKSAELRYFEKITLQNVYRALSKYALSVIDGTHLPSFNDTIQWIRSEKSCAKLPKIATLISPRFFEASPGITIYVRKVNDTTLPHLVGELHFTCLTMVFIVPFSTKDSTTFCADTEFERFWKCFTHYDAEVGWKFFDLSSDDARECIFKIAFQKREPNI